MVKVDLHNHLGINGANPGFDRVIDIAHARLGDGGVFGVCDDGPTDYRYEDFFKQKGGIYSRSLVGDKKKPIVVWVPEKNILVVGVEEVEPEKGGHFLCVGMPAGEKIGTTNLEEALTRAEGFGVGKVIVHPFEYGGFGSYLKNEPGILERFDGFGVYNGSAVFGDWFFPLGFRANQKASDFYKNVIDGNYNVGAVSFTDGHSAGVIGRSHTPFFTDEINPRVGNVLNPLINEMRGSKDDFYLIKRPARWDAAKHVGHMVLHEIRKRLPGKR